jgi:hypothetical protein
MIALAANLAGRPFCAACFSRRFFAFADNSCFGSASPDSGDMSMPITDVPLAF